MAGVRRTVIGINVECYKCKREALQCITQVAGVDMIQVNTKEHTITVEGDADPACVASELKKKFKCTRIISTGPVPPPKPEETKKTEDPKAEKKNGKNGKNGKKEENEPAKKDNPQPASPANPSGHPPPIVCHPRHPPLWVPSDPCRPYDPCRPGHYCECSACSRRSDIMWPRYHPPRASPDEIWYVWNEESQNPCTIC